MQNQKMDLASSFCPAPTKLSYPEPWIAKKIDLTSPKPCAPEDIWQHTSGFWQLTGDTLEDRKIRHIGGVEFAVPAEIPMEAFLQDSQNFHKCSLETKSGYVAVAVAHLMKEQIGGKKIKAPFFADSVPSSSPKKVKSSPKKASRKKANDDDDGRAEDDKKSEKYTTPQRKRPRRLKQHSSDATSPFPAIKTPEGHGRSLDV